MKLQTELKPKIKKAVKLLKECLKMIEEKQEYDNEASQRSKRHPKSKRKDKV